jgi:hypothetical protein
MKYQKLINLNKVFVKGREYLPVTINGITRLNEVRKPIKIYLKKR